MVVMRVKKHLIKLSIPLIILGSSVIYFLLENYTTVHFKIIIYTLITLATFPIFLYTIDIFILYRIKKEQLTTYVSFIGMFINIVIAFISTPIYGILGVITGVCISQWIMFFIYRYKIKTLIKG